MRMTATDGHRLSFVDKEVFLKQPEFKRGIIIPRKGLQEFRKILSEANDSVGIAFERGYIFCQQEETSLFVRLIEGEYPDYRLVIPKAADKLAKIRREEFIAALKRMNLFASEKSGGVKITLSQGNLTIVSSNPDMGDAREEMDVEYQGETVEIAFNARYLLECLSVISSPELEFHFKDRLSPGVLQGGEQKNHTYVIMPMRM
jgi:DNA polymerase-3 subunit beta